MVLARLRIVVVVTEAPPNAAVVSDLNAMRGLERVIAQMDDPRRSGFERFQAPAQLSHADGVSGSPRALHARGAPDHGTLTAAVAHARPSSPARRARRGSARARPRRSALGRAAPGVEPEAGAGSNSVAVRLLWGA